MGLMHVEMFQAYLETFENRELEKSNPGTIFIGHPEMYELAPLSYVNETDKRIEYLNILAKLLHPHIAYGAFQNDRTSEYMEENNMLSRLRDFIDMFETGVGALNGLTNIFPQYKKGIPTRVQVFERDVVIH